MDSSLAPLMEAQSWPAWVTDVTASPPNARGKNRTMYRAYLECICLRQTYVALQINRGGRSTEAVLLVELRRLVAAHTGPGHSRRKRSRDEAAPAAAAASGEDVLKLQNTELQKALLAERKKTAALTARMGRMEHQLQAFEREKLMREQRIHAVPDGAAPGWCVVVN